MIQVLNTFLKPLGQRFLLDRLGRGWQSKERVGFLK